jgi:hypothetical protein
MRYLDAKSKPSKIGSGCLGAWQCQPPKPTMQHAASRCHGGKGKERGRGRRKGRCEKEMLLIQATEKEGNFYRHFSAPALYWDGTVSEKNGKRKG